MLLSELTGLLNDVLQVEPDMDVEIGGVCLDSRKVRKGDLFFCVEGHETDGHHYALEAVKRGAVGVVCSRRVGVGEAVRVMVEDVRRDMSLICRHFNGYPDRRMGVVGITGTNGKTTVGKLIQELGGHFLTSGYIGTIGVSYPGKNREAELTTPDPVGLYGTLREMADGGVELAVLEASSQGLSMGRVLEMEFDACVFTNLTHDHLDYHRTMEAYRDAKMQLFRQMKEGGVAVVNGDDLYCEDVLRTCRGKKTVTFGRGEGVDYRAVDIQEYDEMTYFRIVHEGKEYRVVSRLPGLFNVYNVLAAAAVLGELGFDLERVANCVPQVWGVEGRMERIEAGQPFRVIVDFAHTPDGFHQVMEYAHRTGLRGGRMICVFGSAGGRDWSKRPVFGQIAGRFCSEIVLTEDDPRTEDPAEIAGQICEGVDEGVRVVYEEDRYRAIARALGQAKRGDTVLILGKGRERFMYRGKGRQEWMGDGEAVLSLWEGVGEVAVTDG